MDRTRLFLALVVAAAALGAMSRPAAAQTIRPVIVEHHGHRASGRFELVNDGLTTVHVVLEPKGFLVTPDGEPIYGALPAGVQVRLSAMTLRIPPRQSRWVFYRVTADSLPAWFVIPCTFSGLPTRAGLDLRVELPHTVYLAQRQPLGPTDVAVRSCVYRAETGQVEVELENHSGSLGRALEAQVIGQRHRERANSFPLCPHAVRRLKIPWPDGTRPERVVVRFDRFAIDQPLAEASALEP